MVAPIIIKDPQLIIQPLLSTGLPDGAPVDVSADVSAVELGVEQDIATVKTFAGTFRVPGDPEGSATISMIVGPDTESNWTPLIGKRLQVRIYDRADATRYRQIESEISFDPSLYGPTDADEEVRAFDFEIPVYAGPVWVAVGP